MTRRGAILAGAAVLVLAGLASVAFAKGHGNLARQDGEVPNPHGAFSVDTDLCALCHSQHDAKDEALSPYERDRQLCLQCHSITQHNHGNPPRGSQLRGCTNCHSAVHGSHSDPLLKY